MSSSRFGASISVRVPVTHQDIAEHLLGSDHETEASQGNHQHLCSQRRYLLKCSLLLTVSHWLDLIPRWKKGLIFLYSKDSLSWWRVTKLRDLSVNQASGLGAWHYIWSLWLLFSVVWPSCWVRLVYTDNVVKNFKVKTVKCSFPFQVEQKKQEEHGLVILEDLMLQLFSTDSPATINNGTWVLSLLLCCLHEGRKKYL